MPEFLLDYIIHINYQNVPENGAQETFLLLVSMHKHTFK